MKTRSAVLFGALLAALAVGGTSLAAPPTQARVERLYETLTVGRTRVPTLDVEELTDDMLLVDVRPDEERAVSMLPGAIPLSELLADPAKFQARKLVFYCTIGVRSHSVTREWQQRGLDVANLRGSALAWTHAGKPLVTPEGAPTRTLHTWSRTFALQAEGYEATW